MDNKVYAVRCTDYAQASEKLGLLLDMMGGMGRFARGGETLALKANLLEAIAPDRAVTTHPSVAAAVATQTVKAGAKAVILDSPGGGHWQNSPAALEKLYNVTGMAEAARQSGAELNYDMSREQRSFPQGELVRSFEVLSAPFQADGILNLCKLKTHGMVGFSGAVKNLFGAVPGLQKPELHCRFPEKQPFSEMLVDLCDFLQPDLCIMDGILAMEGNGPTGGQPRKMGVLGASKSPYALDVCGAALIGMKPESVLMLKEANRRGLGPLSPEECQLVKEPVAPLAQPDFVKAKASSTDFIDRLPSFLRPAAKKIATPTPKIRKKECVGCGRCAESCPQHTIQIREGKAVIDYKNCIRCFCCHEMCPKHVIDIKRWGLLHF